MKKTLAFDKVIYFSCQILLADLWHGGLRIRSHSNVKVIGGIVFPVSIALMEFKTKDELLNQPQVRGFLFIFFLEISNSIKLVIFNTKTFRAAMSIFIKGRKI